jgi:hypothetical protein
VKKVDTIYLRGQTENMLRCIKIFKNVVLGMSVFVFCSCFSWAKAAIQSGKTTVIFIGNQSTVEFESKVEPFFRNQLKTCKSCVIVNMTPYDENGNFDIKQLAKKIEDLPAESSFVFFGFNTKVTEQTKKVIEALNKRAGDGLVVVGTAGVPEVAEPSGPLSRTMLGQVQGALIIGELGQKDRLVPTGFYGPEMLTAVRPPKDKMGQGIAPLIFAAALAENWSKRPPHEWVEFLKAKKMKTRRIWLELGEVF